MTWVRLRLPAFCTVRLLIFSFYLLFFGSQPTLLEGREDLHNLFNYLCRYRHMDIYFILWVIIQYHRRFILSYFNFLNPILLLHLVLCGVWYSMCSYLLSLSLFLMFILSFFKSIGSVLLLWLVVKVIFIVRF